MGLLLFVYWRYLVMSNFEKGTDGVIMIFLFLALGDLSVIHLIDTFSK